MTYKTAKETHLAALAALGWVTKPSLKVPHATSPDGFTRIYFKSQAVYASNDGKSLKVARSIHCDSRTISTLRLIEESVSLANFSRDHNTF